MRQSLRLACCLVAVAFAAISQTDHGTITGTVQDPAKAVVPNAGITATNTETGAIYQTATTGNRQLHSGVAAREAMPRVPCILFPGAANRSMES